MNTRVSRDNVGAVLGVIEGPCVGETVGLLLGTIEMVGTGVGDSVG